MKRLQLRWPTTTAVSLLAALTTWVSLWAWAGFVERPSGFLIPALGACLLVAVTGMLLRSARVAAALVVLAQAAVLVTWLGHVWAETETLLGWVPTPGSLRELALLAQEGATAAQDFAAPVPDSVAQIHPLLVFAGAATAVIVDFLACGLRRVPAGGLALLAVYTAPVSILDGGVPWWAFVGGALSFLLLLTAEEARRLSGWGRQISTSGRLLDTVDTTVSAQTIRPAARKIGLTATGLAVAVPIFVPTLGTSLFNGTGIGPGGDGGGVSISNPIVDLRRDLTRGRDIDLVTVTTNDPDPSYLRISVLDVFDGETWKPSQRDIPVDQRADGSMPLPTGLSAAVPRQEVSYDIEVSPEFGSRWLPTPFPASEVSARGDWRFDDSTRDFVNAIEGETAAGLTYTAEALLIQPSPLSLANAGPAPEKVFTEYIPLPDSVPASVSELARDVTNSAPTRFEKAVRLQDWFRVDGGFTYSLDRASGNGSDDLVAFLAETPGGRVGYCEQFAAAMAVMGRSLGIPSRVSVGFLRPQRISDNTYVYSAHDLHAWPEMYFQGVGWIRFEPTPPDRATGVPGYTVGGIPQESPTEAPTTAGPSRAPNEADRRQPDQGALGNSSGPTSSGGLRDALTWMGVALLAIAALVTPRMARSWVSRRRWARATTPVDFAEAAWDELRARAIDLGVPWDDSVTLRTRARALVGSFGAPGPREESPVTRSARTGPGANPEATRALERLVQWVERARFARSLQEVPDLRADVHLCGQAMRDGADRRRRLKADWLPVSLMRNRDMQLRRDAAASALHGYEPGVDRVI